jgi:S-formylglutathione hydrolase
MSVATFDVVRCHGAFGMTIQTVSTNKSHGGVQGVYRHASEQTKTEMTFSVFVPPHQDGAKLPVVWYLSGLT